MFHFSVDYGFLMFYSTGPKFVGRFIFTENQMESKRAYLALKFLGINQVCYIRRKSKKLYNYLQAILNPKLFTKAIIMPKWKTCLRRPGVNFTNIL